MSKKLNETQQIAIQLLASGKSCTAVAKELDVSKETVSRWKQLPEFRAGINILVEEAREAIRSKMIKLASNALEVIESDLQAQDDPARRSKAAYRILQLIGNDALALPQEPLMTDSERIYQNDMFKNLTSM